MVQAISTQCEEQLFKMHPKDLALIVWCQARLKFPLKHPFVEMAFKLVARFIMLMKSGDIMYMPSEIGSKPVSFEMDFDEELD